ncbi:MFS transporter [Sphingomonas sp. MMS24-J45]|uniref:MFS transporter n=1 Tax=Sphingomonas sp. MMS24-J45 TaxID=3238806 RepID=UPI003850FC03
MAASLAPAGVAVRVLAHRPMHWRQILAVALSVALNALDGFDVLAVTFAAPGISKAWGIGPAQLGAALSAGLVGMTLGSLLLGPFGDRFGRRPLVLVCLVLMAAGMALTATATGIVSLCIWRVLTGLGIGGMVAAINAVASEFANERRRDFCVAVMTIGYPIGGLVGGFAVAEVIMTHGWQSVFAIGGVATAAFIPLIWFGLPESLDYLARQNTPEARAKIAATLASFNHPVGEVAPEPVAAPAPLSSGSYAVLLGPLYRRTTILLVVAYFLHIMTFYFFSGWLPKLMSDLGYATPDAIRTSALMSLGGILGGSALGWAAPRLGLVRLLIVAMLGTSATFLLFGFAVGLPALQVTAFLAGICVFGGIVGLYALLARSFPPELRVTGTGLAIGVGRGGAVLGPLIGGFLIAAGTSIPLAIAIVGAGATIAAVMLMAMGHSLSATSQR